MHLNTDYKVWLSHLFQFNLLETFIFDLNVRRFDGTWLSWSLVVFLVEMGVYNASHFRSATFNPLRKTLH